MVVLRSERLLFRDHILEDLEPFCALEQDADFRRYVGGAPRPRHAAERRFHERFLRATTDRLKLWATELVAERRYVGYCGLAPHFGPSGPFPDEGALAFYLAPDVWGRGLATEAGRAWVAHGFGPLRLSRIVASVDARNTASMRVLEKLGFSWLRTGGPGGRPIHELELRRPQGAGPCSG